MKFPKDTRDISRYLAFDIHKEYVLVGGQNARQEWVMQPRRVGSDQARQWAEANLRKGDAVILETTTNAWDIYDIVAPPKGALTDPAWWEAQPLRPLEKIQIRQELAMLEELDRHKAEVDAELARQSLGERWGKQAADHQRRAERPEVGAGGSGVAGDLYLTVLERAV